MAGPSRWTPLARSVADKAKAGERGAIDWALRNEAIASEKIQHSCDDGHCGHREARAIALLYLTVKP
jgi:hypothetical protein